MATPIRLLVCGALVLFGAACGTHSDDDAADQSLWPADATQLALVNAGGGLPAPTPAGSDCADSGVGTFTVSVADRKLSWDYCAYQMAGGNKHLTDARTLTANEFQSVVSAVKAVAISTKTDCGADKPTEKLQITTPASTKEYLDDFYACSKQGVYITNIDAVFDVLYHLAFPSP